MAARSRSRSRSRSRPSVGRRRSGVSAISSAGELLFRLEAVGVALVVLALIAIPWLVPATSAASSLRDDIVRTLGLFVFVVIAFVAYVGFTIFRRRYDLLFLWWKPWAVGLLAAAFLIGALGFFRPDWQVGNVSMNDVSAGGDLGHFFAGSLIGLIIWLLIGASAFTLATPEGAAAVANAVVVGARTAWGWEIPQKTGRSAHALRELIFPTRPPPEGAEKIPLDSVEWAQRADPTAVADEDLEEDEEYEDDEEELEEEDEEEYEEEEDDEDELAPDTGKQGRLPLSANGLDEEDEEELEEVVPGKPRKARDGWQLPPLDVLVDVAVQDGEPDNEGRAGLIVETLASFGVDARVVQVNEGPTVTQFGIEPGWEVKTRQITERDAANRPVLDRTGRPKVRVEEVSRTRIRVNQITTLANDLALALAAPSLRMESPVPGKPFVGIEVPNNTASLVTLRSIIESAQFRRASLRSRLALALGKSVAGEPAVSDLAKMPHLLIAGATGSGKSVCINSIIACILMHASPEEVRFVMIDPKRVELAAFGDIPHLAFSSIITDMDQVVGTLQAVIHEMESRYRRFASLAVRNIESYNKHPRCPTKLPYWVMIIDELADLMMAAPYEVERQICRLAQLARATGIHLIVATQRPSVDVVTGLIKANFPTRIAFAMSSQVDSRTILDTAGAEKLLGRGDMLYLPTDAAKPRRLQGVFVSDQEIEQLVNFWTQDRFQELEREVFDHLLEEAKTTTTEMPESDDPMLEKALALAHAHQRISTSMLQRRLRIGYPRAARLMDMLEAQGVVGPAEGTGSRPVLALVAVGEDDEE
ncbi:MAG: DNA translocase FtsK [Dehalococcoidia bacterium]